MNAPQAPSLESLYAQRKALLPKRAEIAASREKLSSVDTEAEAAAQALVKFANEAATRLNSGPTAAAGGLGRWRTRRSTRSSKRRIKTSPFPSRPLRGLTLFVVRGFGTESLAACLPDGVCNARGDNACAL
jgi:hypothetical protein